MQPCWKCDCPPPFSINMERRKQKNRCMYLCRPVWHLHWCYVHVAGRQGHTQTHTGTEAAGERCLQCLLSPPDGLHHRATGLFLPCFLCPPPLRCRGHRVKAVVLPSDSHWAVSHTPGHQATRREFHRLLPLDPKEDPKTLSLLGPASDCCCSLSMFPNYVFLNECLKCTLVQFSLRLFQFINVFIPNGSRHVKTAGFSPWLCHGGDSQPHMRGW